MKTKDDPGKIMGEILKRIDVLDSFVRSDTQLLIQRTIWNRLVRIEDKLDELLEAKKSDADASSQVRKLAAMSYAIAKDIERRGR